MRNTSLWWITRRKQSWSR